MSAETPKAPQRAHQPAIRQLAEQAETHLGALHADLLELSPAYDGTVYFAVDQWHANNASAVATVQPSSDDHERFAFYKKHIEKRRVDLGATALGTGLRLPEPQYLPSRMNPKAHMTWANAHVIDNQLVGGTQVAFNKQYGVLPGKRLLGSVIQKHHRATEEVAEAFSVAGQSVDSLGDTLELLAPSTPNAFILSWDVTGSSKLASSDHYGALRNYLIDAKNMFHNLTNDYRGDYHDTGDGQDMLLWLPDGIDRANPTAVKQFGEQKMIPLAEEMLHAHKALADAYRDIDPAIRLVVGLGYVEKDKFDELTSAEYWEIGTMHKHHSVEPIAYTKAAQQLLSRPVANES